VRRLSPALLVIIGVISLFLVNTHSPRIAAASADTVNFQARLQSSTGAIVPDGTYNVEFKLYNATGTSSNPGSCTTATNCVWSEDYTGSNMVTVKNGYLSVALGSITPFPTTIDWSQQLYLTMDIGGTGLTPSWDGEMQPRLPLTATPYSFLAQTAEQASEADELSTTNSNGTSTLSIQGPASGSGGQTFVIQDQGSAGTYDLLTTSQADSDYVQVQSGSAVQQSGNLAISGAATAGSIETGSLDTASAGTIDIGATNASAISLGNTTNNIATTINGTVLVKPTSGHDSTTAFQVQPAGSSTPVLNVDTTDDQVDIGTSTGEATLTVQGTTSDSSASGLIVNDSGGNSLLQVRNDGQVTLGESSSSTSETIGHSSIGASADNGFEQLIIASKITTGNLAPTLTSISAYVQATDVSPNNKYVLGIYSDNNGAPGSLLALSSQGTLTAAAWNTLPISVGLAANTSYWLAFSTNTTSNTTDFVPYDTGGSDTHAYMSGYAYAGSSMPSSFTANATGGVLDSIYATVEESGSLGTTLSVSPADGVNITTPTNTPTALQVQNASGNSLFDVDTSGNNVNIGSTGSTALSSTVNIATSSNDAQTINIGSDNDGSNTVNIQGGTSSNAIGVQAGTGGSINLGSVNDNNINIGTAAVSGQITIGGASETGNITVGQYTGASSSTVDLGDGTTTGTQTVMIGAGATGSGRDTVTLGSTNGASSTTVQGGTGGVGINVSSGSTISIGATTAATVTIGSTSSTNATTLQGEGISQKMSGSATNPTDTIATSTNSSSAFQVQDAADDSIFNVSTITTLINDSMVTTAPTGTFNNGASWSSGNDVILDNGGPGVDGEVNYKLTNVGSYFNANFNFWSENGGNDGTWFYAYDTSIPGSFHLGSTYGGGGYAFAYYDTNSTVDIYYNGTLLTSASISAVNTGTWQSAEIIGNGTTFTMYLNGTSVLTYTDTSRSLTGTNFGLGGCSCSQAGEHLAKNFTFSTDAVGIQVPVTQTNEIDTTTTLGTLTIGGNNATTINLGDNIGSTTVNIGDGAVNGSADTVTLGSTNGSSTTTIQGGTGGLSVNVASGSTISIGTASSQTVALGSTSGTSTTTLQGEGISQKMTGSATNPTDLIQTSTNSTAAFEVENSSNVNVLTADTADSLIIIGSNNATNTSNKTLLQLNSYNSFSDPTSCGTTSNQGALYYSLDDSSGTNAIRACVNGSWQDILSAGDLGLELFGVVPDSPNAGTPGDLGGISGNTNSPCKVYWSGTQQVSVAPCIAYSGGREVVVNQATVSTASIAASTYVNLCLTGTGSQPALVGSGNASEGSVPQPTWSATAPIVCLATIETSATAGNVGEIYDVRTFTDTTKTISTYYNGGGSSTLDIGMLVTYSGSSANTVTPPTSESTGLAGVVVAYSGSSSNSAPNIIIATAGPQWVKAVSGTTRGEAVVGSTTTGFAQSVSTISSAGFYQMVGMSALTTSTACTNSGNCQYSEFLNPMSPSY
jgi:hypothetical protein